MIVDNPQKNGRRNTIVIKIEKWLEFKKFIPHRCGINVFIDESHRM